MENTENMVEFISGTRTATVTFTNQKHINRMKKLYEERKDDFKYFKENKDWREENDNKEWICFSGRWNL